MFSKSYVLILSQICDNSGPIKLTTSYFGKGTIIDMGFSGTFSLGGHVTPLLSHNFAVSASIIMKFDTAMKLDMFYAVATTNLSRHDYYVIIIFHATIMTS